MLLPLVSSYLLSAFVCFSIVVNLTKCKKNQGQNVTKMFHFCHTARQNITRFQTLTELSEQKVARFAGVYTGESVRNKDLWRSKS